MRRIAERVRSCDEMRRLAEAGTVSALCELAESYHVGYDDVVGVLAERRVQLGASGTPLTSEFVCLEVAGLLRCTPTVAASRLADALNLKHRHPGLYRAMQQLEVEPARACKAAQICRELPPEVADAVTGRWVGRQEALGWSAAFTLLKKLVIDADPVAAAAREAAQRADRGVHVWGLYDGVMNLTGRLDVLDARYLDAAVDRIADLLAAERPQEKKSVLRAKALGVLANPAYALAMLQRAAQPALVEHPATDDGQRHDPHCLGALCGTITTPPAKLRPTLELAVHVHADAVGTLAGAARIERAGHITTALLAELLTGVDVTVQPVIDLPEIPAEHRYVPSVRLKKAVQLAMDREAFPYSNRRSKGLDLDHTDPYAVGVRPWRTGQGQTRMGNLTPLGRTIHRAKTAVIWRVSQPRPAKLIWTSPLGYRYETQPRATRMLA
jgi:hypothetical protein